MKHVIGIVARARGIKDTAEAAGVTREALHRALGEKGNPRLSTSLGVTKVLGPTLKVEASA
ncbi:addiction module antidote protein [Rhodovulum sulfidophilum]|uniref:addiction module antidote protein n=1 Tax=Rhodovulum sulfidophilum TaxID=35806 RepID=UPI001C4D6160